MQSGIGLENSPLKWGCSEIVSRSPTGKGLKSYDPSHAFYAWYISSFVDDTSGEASSSVLIRSGGTTQYGNPMLWSFPNHPGQHYDKGQ